MNQTENITTRRESTPEGVKQRATVAPLVDVYENQDELLIVADVPGATQDSIHAHFERGQLTIEAHRKSELPKGALLGSEYRAVDYFRAFTIPQGIDASKIDAQLSGGVLKLRLPKSEALKPRRIEVKTG